MEDTPRDPEFELTLPKAEEGMVSDLYRQARVVLEYGSGGSTFLAKQLGVQAVFSVESDRRWARRLRASIAQQHPEGGVHVHYVDIGPTKAWGRPRDTSGFANYPLYACSVWDLEVFEQPDVVLIDGRFRAACYLATMFRTAKTVDVLFDDYFNRRRYHWIEEFGAPVARAGRMAHFRVAPTAFPPDAMTRILQSFSDPN